MQDLAANAVRHHRATTEFATAAPLEFHRLILRTGASLMVSPYLGVAGIFGPRNVATSSAFISTAVALPQGRRSKPVQLLRYLLAM